MSTAKDNNAMQPARRLGPFADGLVCSVVTALQEIPATAAPARRERRLVSVFPPAETHGRGTSSCRQPLRVFVSAPRPAVASARPWRASPCARPCIPPAPPHRRVRARENPLPDPARRENSKARAGRPRPPEPWPPPPQ